MDFTVQLKNIYKPFGIFFICLNNSLKAHQLLSLYNLLPLKHQFPAYCGNKNCQRPAWRAGCVNDRHSRDGAAIAGSCGCQFAPASKFFLQRPDRLNRVSDNIFPLSSAWAQAFCSSIILLIPVVAVGLGLVSPPVITSKGPLNRCCTQQSRHLQSFLQYRLCQICPGFTMHKFQPARKDSCLLRFVAEMGSGQRFLIFLLQKIVCEY